MVTTARLIIVREKIQVITIYNLNTGFCCNLMTFKVFKLKNLLVKAKRATIKVKGKFESLKAFEFSLNFYRCSFRFDKKIFETFYSVYN